jgi:hypothetical protein
VVLPKVLDQEKRKEMTRLGVIDLVFGTIFSLAVLSFVYSCILYIAQDRAKNTCIADNLHSQLTESDSILITSICESCAYSGRKVSRTNGVLKCSGEKP